MKTTKNDKRQILPSKNAKFVSFFVRFVRVFTPFHQSKSGPENHGSIHVLLLGCAVCVANLQHVALADFGSTDSSNLSTLRAATQQIRDQLEGPTVLQSMTIKQQLWNLENINSNASTRANVLVNMMAGKDNLRDWYDLGTMDNYLMGGSANGYTTFSAIKNYIGPVRYSMLEMLDMLNRFNGSIQTSSSSSVDGYAQYYNATLPEMILGWAPSREQHISGSLYTNGVIGRINEEISTMSNVGSNIVDKMEWQTEQITNAIYSVRDLASIMANNQTNLMYINSAFYTGQDGWVNLSTVGDFVNWINENGLQFSAQSSIANSAYYFPLYLLPLDRMMDEGFPDWVYNDFGLFNRYSFQDGIADTFYQYYGNFATYDKAFGPETSYGQYEFEGSSNIVNQTRSIRPALTNDNPSTLLPIQGIPEISGDVADFISIKNDYADLSGPSQAEITKWAGYFENTVSESRETAGFQFGITFAGVGNEEVSVETENVDFFESINLQRISQIGNTWIGYGVSIVKGLLMLMFVWAVAEKAVGIFVNNGMQAG